MYDKNSPLKNPRFRTVFKNVFGSNWGPRVDVAAPGDKWHDLTCSASGDDKYKNEFGCTSGATPKVAGTVALMLQCNPFLTPAEVREIIKSTASPTIESEVPYRPIGSSSTVDRPIGGLLNTYEAVKEACRRAVPDPTTFIFDACRHFRVMGEIDVDRIRTACQNSNILVDPCRLRTIVEGPCIRDRIIIGPCGTELIAGDPFWRPEEFKGWPEASDRIRGETLKHFKRLSE
jgi:hypothetical protein